MLPVIQESIRFVPVVCTVRKKQAGTGEDVNDQARAFEGAFHFDALKRKAHCNFSALLGSEFYAEL